MEPDLGAPDESAPVADGARSGRRIGRRGAAVAAGVALLVVVGIIVAGSGGDESNADGASTSVATTVIKRQDLVETDTEDGTLGFADSRDVINHLSGTVTWLPKEGRVVRPNEALYRVDGTPVVLLAGTRPASRTLSASSSTSGRDVLQLERNLRALGYDKGHDMKVDGTWSGATTTSVERWQQAHGLDETGSIDLGRVVFQPGKRRVAQLNVALGVQSSSGGGAGGSSTSTSPSTASAPAGETSHFASAVYVEGTAVQSQDTPRMVAVVDQTDTTTTTTPTTTTPTTTSPTTTTPTTPSKPAKPTTTTTPSTPSAPPAGASGGAAGAGASAAGMGGGSAAGSAGATGGSGVSSSSTPANAIMTTTSTRKVVTVELETTKSELARVGAKVSIDLPSGKLVHGRIIDVAKVATAPADSGSDSSSSSSSTATIEVTIGLGSQDTVLDQAPVTVRFEESRVKDALAIPVTALLARPGGRFAVEVVDGPDRRVVPVTPGVYTSGYVEIEGAGLRPGMRVTNAAIQ